MFAIVGVSHGDRDVCHRCCCFLASSSVWRMSVFVSVKCWRWIRHLAVMHLQCQRHVPQGVRNTEFLQSSYDRGLCNRKGSLHLLTDREVRALDQTACRYESSGAPS